MGTNLREQYSTEQQEILLALGETLYQHFEALARIFDHEAMDDTRTNPECMSMLGFFGMLKKCHVPHPEIPLALCAEAV